MKNILNLTKQFTLVLCFILLYQTANACANRGNIKMDSSQCKNGLAKLFLINHTTAAGTVYTWQSSNDQGLSFTTLTNNSGRDTQLIPLTLDRMYICISTCLSGTVRSDTLNFNLLPRQITVDQVFCSPTAGGNDSLLLALTPHTLDAEVAKTFRWQYSTTAGNVWADIGSNSSVLKVKFTKNYVYYRAYVTFCRLPGNGPSGFPLPGSRSLVQNNDSFGLKSLELSLTKDCTNPNDTAALSLGAPGAHPSLVNFLKFNWLDSNQVTGVFNYMGLTASSINVRVDSMNRFYKANVKLCTSPHPSVDSVATKNYVMWVKLGAFTPAVNCTTDEFELDYAHRDLARNSVHLSWTRSKNDSLNHLPYTDPDNTIKHSVPQSNGLKYYYKVYSKFCPTSTKILDSTFNNFLQLNVDTGQLKGSFQTCTNDSVYIKLLSNIKDSSNFPLIKKWQIKRNGNPFWEDYNLFPQTDSSIAFRMSNGLTSFRKVVSLCPGKYAKSYRSSEASTFLPFQPTYNANCTSNMSINVLNDSVKIIDFSGTTVRSNSTFGYQWIRTTNKVASTIVAGATSASLTITQADRGAFFKRLTRICSANTFSDSTNWSNITSNNPTVQNGRSTVVGQICLNDTVNICVDNFLPFGTDTPTYVWQFSSDDINWKNMNTDVSNNACVRAVVGAEFQYFRRLTLWCGSGRIDSSVSTPLIYIRNLPYFESFTGQGQFGEDILFNCWRSTNIGCNSYSPSLTGGKVWSEAGGGKSGKHMSNWGPTPTPDVNKTPANARRNDLKLITPAFSLKRGKVYRFSFWHREDGSNICWDSLYATWGNVPTPCAMTNRFGETLAKFSFDQWNKFWSDFSPPDDGIYHFAINIRDKDATTGEIKFDEVGLKEIESCEGKSPTTGRTVAPSRTIDRSEDPDLAPNYDKSNVAHQYCIHDTIMLTYTEGNYGTFPGGNFDYHGMSYQFYKKRSDADWKVEDTFFRPVIGDTLCHITNRSNYHVMNVLVTDTHTWYKIVATCDYNGKQFHSDSVLINGTHSVPWCEDWEGIGGISGNMPPVSSLPNGNSSHIAGRVPSFSLCPTCWAAFPQQNENQPPLPAPGASGGDLTFNSVSTPLLNPPPGPPAVPQLAPDGGYAGRNVVMLTDNRALNPTLRKILVMPAVRLHKGRGYRVSFRWTDNRTSTQSPWGSVNQDLDSLYVVVAKGNLSGRTKDSFVRGKMAPNALRLNLQSNILENGPGKYRTYWLDYTPVDTGTYYFGIVVVAGPANGVAYRFVMDYFCVDTTSIDDCNDTPKFNDPLRVRVSPDAKTWVPGDSIFTPSGIQWCVGNRVNLDLDFGIGIANAWRYGYKMLWQCTQQDWRIKGSPDSALWNTIDSSNGISYVLSNKFRDCRLILANSCMTKFDTVGPFKVYPYRGTESCLVGTRETYLNTQFNYAAVLPQCWDVYPACRVTVLDDMGVGNEFHQMSKLDKNYLDMDFISNKGNSCPIPTVQTAVPPGYGATGGVTYRFSFWYKDNGLSVPIDSIVAGYSFSRPTDAYQVRLLNRVNNDIVRNSKTNRWRYYTTEVMSALDTAFHFKIKTFNLGNKRIYRTLFDDLLFKPKQNIDALVIAIDSPEYACDLKANTTVKVTVMNIGTSPITNLPLKVQVGTGTPTSYVVPGSLASNEARTVFVPNVDLSVAANHEVKAWTEAPGEQFLCDDTFTTRIVHLEMPLAPTDTIDSVCVCTSHTMTAPYNNARWYRNATDFTPIYNGPEFTMDSICKDTSIYYSMWNGAVDYTYPPNFSYGAPTFSAAVGGISFDNISKDTILIDSVMVYVNTLNPAQLTFPIELRQFNGAQQVTLTTITLQNFTRLGRQWIPIKLKIAPGTDYKLIYRGTSALAQLPGFIFLGAGSTAMDIQFYGDEGYPTIPTTAYKYFFNWKLIKLGCESERVKKTLKVIPSPKFQLKDTARICSRPVFEYCGPMAPTGDIYRYQWASADPNDTNRCKVASASGWYKLTVTNEFGCKEVDSTQVIVDPSPQFNLGPDTSFCRFSPFTVTTGLDSIKNTVTWNDNQVGVNIKILNPGLYIATAYSTENFCTAKDTINIIRHELPVFSLGNDRVFCGNSADLQALATNMPSTLTYTWQPSGPVISASNTYVAVGTDPVTGCKNTDTIKANMQPKPPFDLGPNVNACGSVYTINGPLGNYFYKWSTTATSRSITVSTPGTYYLTITNKTFGCDSIDSVKVSFKSVPVFDLGPDVVKCATTHPINGPAPAPGDTYNYSWKKPNGVFSTPSASANSFLADESGVYYLRVDNNCYNFTDSMRLTLKKPATDAIDLLFDTAGCKSANLQATSTTNYTNLKWSVPTASLIPDTAKKSNLLKADVTGTYSVSLTNECGTASKAANIRIDELPVANFTVEYLDDSLDCMSIVLVNTSKNGISYSWSFGDGKTSTLENPMHVYSIEGSFLVTLKTYNACGFSSKTVAIKKRVKNCPTSGINNFDLNTSDIYVFPNPATDNTQILGVGMPNGNYKLSIRNLLGQSIYENELKVIGNEVNFRIETAKFANGEYLIELSNDSESIVRKLQIVK